MLPAVPFFEGDEPSHRRWVLARRSIARPDEIAYHLTYAATGATVNQLVTVAGSRWAIECCFQSAKNECGLDQYEVRRYPGWNYQRRTRRHELRQHDGQPARYTREHPLDQQEQRTATGVLEGRGGG